ncbi:MAG: formimidoylglutamase [Rhodothermales bacterium]|nr:formimidoylglutamase [Rhodothermales bacterium]
MKNSWPQVLLWPEPNGSRQESLPESNAYSIMIADPFSKVTHLLVTPDYGVESGNAVDRRMWHYLAEARGSDTGVVLIGFPIDEGVVRNGGRAGAAASPDRIRTLLSRFTPDARNPDRSLRLLNSVRDLGNIQPAETLEQSQERLAEVVEYVLSIDCIPIILGGGHETTLGHFLGYRNQTRRPSILNIDSHADVRALKDGLGHSGSPFRQAADAVPGPRTYTVAGLQPSSVAAGHLQFLDKRGFRYFWRDEVTSRLLQDLLNEQQDPLLVTFDLDVVDHAQAPGVSAPCVNGIDARELLRFAFECGKSDVVRSFDIVELNPKYDVDNRTARLAARTVWEFLQGLSERERFES